MTSKSAVFVTGALALASAGFVGHNYLEEKSVPLDTSPSAQPAARAQYLTKTFPEFATDLEKLPMDIHTPTKTWKNGKNEHHALYQLGRCSKLPEDWTISVVKHFGETNQWGRVQKQTSNDPVSVRVRFNREGYVHIFVAEYNPSSFADKPWYKFGRTPSDIKSSYIMAITCDNHP